MLGLLEGQTQAKTMVSASWWRMTPFLLLVGFFIPPTKGRPLETGFVDVWTRFVCRVCSALPSCLLETLFLPLIRYCMVPKDISSVFFFSIFIFVN